MEKRKKSIVVGVTSLLLVTLLLLGLTYAYYRTRIVGNTNTTSVSVTSKNLSVKYQNESATINATGIEPGYSTTKTFEVKNTGDKTVNYSVMLDNVENAFARADDWAYAISENDTELKTGILPKSDSYILYNESISAGATKSYTLKIEYANSNADQSVDMGKSLSLRINIGNSLGSTLTSASEGTLLYAINRDNVISEPLTVPGRQASGIASYQESAEWSSSFNSNSGGYANRYLVYGTGYIFDEKTGSYSLTGVTTTSDTYENSYNELVGKYMVYVASDFNCSHIKEQSLTIAETSGVGTIYKVTSATSGSYTYQKKTYSNASYINEALLAAAEDDYGTSYYYRGNVTNNYVNYSGMCWRIVRVQGDGTIKLALANEHGECPDSFYSTTAFIGDAVKFSFNGNGSVEFRDDLVNILNAWAGLNENRDYTYLDRWSSHTGTFTNNELDASKLVDTEWCNDTTSFFWHSWGWNYTNGIIVHDESLAETWYSGYNYGAYNRLKNVQTAKPTLKCNMKGIDAFTHKEVQAKKYTGKIALLTADEVAFSGSTNRIGSGYLRTNASGGVYWTMSPERYWSWDPPEMVVISSDGIIGVADGSSTYSQNDFLVRPAVVLNSNVTITEGGNGTQTNPYVIS